jgi:nucleotide-binding universal stress UspA family protein
LHVLHVTGNVVAEAIGIEGYTTDWTALQREVDDAARKQLEGIVTEDDRQTLSAKGIVITSNSSAQAIVSYANDAHVDLIVVGTHGRGGMAHLLMGSVAERVVRTAPCPVLTVRHTAETLPSSEASQAITHA